MLESTSPRRLTMFGIIAVGTAVAVSSFGIVRAERAGPKNSAIFRCDKGEACVQGQSTGRPNGVVGVSVTGDGAEGVTSAGTGKAGVRGVSRGMTGVSYGAIGISYNGDGVIGVSRGAHGAGIHGISAKEDGVVAESAGTDTVAVRAHAEGSNTAIFFGHNVPNHAFCLIDRNANLSCTGNISAGAVIESTHRNGFGQSVVAYAPESAAATIEDVGMARMVDGVANVRLDPAFAAVMDRSWYYVFLTPLGDTRGLFVSRKTASGFQARETEHGRANLDFDYRIVAHPIDAPNDRLPPAPK
jgi:hypothetical protein